MERKKVFVLMPFKDEFFEVYEILKIHFAENYEFSNAEEEGNQQNILRDIVEPIYHSDIVIADLTGLNPNVMYELGIAHTLNKKTIIITQDELSMLPFDLKQYRVKDYDTHYKKFSEMLDYLDLTMKGAITGEVAFGNPVKDFMVSSNIDDVNKSWFAESSSQLENDSDKGFLDFLTEIEKTQNELTQDINQMNTDMETMSEGISKNVNEINRVKKTGGSGTTTFVKNKVKNAAKYIDTFALELKTHNKTFETSWDNIEINVLGLLENKYAAKGENGIQLKNYLISLKTMQNQIPRTSEAIKKLKISLEKDKGIERSLNQAIRFVNEDLSTTINIFDHIYKSIDTIMAKAKFVVGEIDTTGDDK